MGVLVGSCLWAPFKAGFFFKLSQFDRRASEPDKPSPSWVAVAAISCAGVLPLAEALLLKLTAFDGRVYLLHTVRSGGGRSRPYEHHAASESRPLLSSSQQRSASTPHYSGGSGRERTFGDELQLETIHTRAAWRRAGFVSRLLAVHQFGLLRLGYSGRLTAEHVWKLPDENDPAALAETFYTKRYSGAHKCSSGGGGGDGDGGGHTRENRRGHGMGTAAGKVEGSGASPGPMGVGTGFCGSGGAVSVGAALFAAVQWPFWKACGWAVVQGLGTVAMPLLLSETVAWISSPCYEFVSSIPVHLHGSVLLLWGHTRCLAGTIHLVWAYVSGWHHIVSSWHHIS
jgi:hypothetical protein